MAGGAWIGSIDGRGFAGFARISRNPDVNSGKKPLAQNSRC
jgi:hypothetical protein